MIVNPGWEWTAWLSQIDANLPVAELNDHVRTATVAEDIAIAKYKHEREAQR